MPTPDVIQDPAVESSKIKPVWFVKEAPRLKVIAVEANPLSTILGLYSMNIEVVVSEHHAIVLSPHYYFANPGRDDGITGGGVEGGYRYYTGKYGPHGFFLGGSFLFGVYRYVHRTVIDTPTNTSDDTTADSFGLAVDGGYQILLGEHLVLGGGLGVQYRYFTAQPNYESESHAHQDLFYGSGIRPRFLLAIGGAL